MSSSSFILVCLLVISVNADKSWDYTFKTLNVEIKADYITSDVKLVKISRGDYAMNGSFTLDQELGPNYMVRRFRVDSLNSMCKES